MPSQPSKPPGDPEKVDPLISRFAGDPEMRDLIEFFLTDLDLRARSIRAAFDTGSAQNLRVLAHQLNGAAGGYGFPSIGACAAEIEEALKAGEIELSSLREKIEELITLCRRAGAARRTAA